MVCAGLVQIERQALILAPSDEAYCNLETARDARSKLPQSRAQTGEQMISDAIVRRTWKRDFVPKPRRFRSKKTEEDRDV
jgi:hypothetical protein